MITSKHSFRFIRRSHAIPAVPVSEEPMKMIETKTANHRAGDAVDDRKRSLMKLAGVVGAGAIAASLLPDKAEAFVFGSTPASNVVGLKDSNNNRINPAEEDGNLATVAANSGTILTNTLSLTASSAGGYIRQDSTGTIAMESGGNLAAVATNTSAIASNASTIATNTGSIATNTLALANLQFDGSNNLKVTSTGGGASGVVGLQNTSGTQINPSSDDSMVYLRRMVKVVESQAAVDSSNRQRVAVETAVITSGTITTVSAVTTVSTVSTVSNVSTVAGQGDQMYQDVARNTYANGIRARLAFS